MHYKKIQTIEEKIGKGAYAHVYKAFWKETGLEVAIKSFDVEHIPQDIIDSVLTEVNLLGRLNHPNIVRILGYHRSPECLCFMLEYAEEGSLLSKIRNDRGLPERAVMGYITQVLNALVYLHSCGVIHRDIKAANILLTKKGEVKLGDFGVAAVVEGIDKHYTIVGSPYWSKNK